MTESCSERQHLVSVRPAAGRAPQPREINQFAKVTQSATLSRLDHKGPWLPNAKNKSHDQQRVLTPFMDSECIFRFSFSIWVYISRVPEDPSSSLFSSGQIRQPLCCQWRSQPPGPPLGSLIREEPALPCSAPTGRVKTAIQGQLRAQGWALHLVIPEGPPEAQEKLGRRRVCQENRAVSSHFSKPVSPVLLFTQPWLQGPFIPWHVTSTPTGKRRPNFWRMFSPHPRKTMLFTTHSSVTLV